MEYKGNMNIPEENQVYQQMAQISSKSNQALENDLTSDNISESSLFIDTSINPENIEIENNCSPPLITSSAFKELDIILNDHQPVDSSRIANIDDQCDTSEQQNNPKMKFQEILKQNQNATDPEQDKIQDILLSCVDTVQENQNKMKKINLQSQTILGQNNQNEHAATLKQKKKNKQNHLTDKNELSAIDYKIMYVLLALAFGASIWYNMSIFPDNKSMKIQLDRAQISIDELNMEIRAINTEKITLQNRLHEVLTQTSDNPYHTEIIRITSERDSLKIKVQEAENQIKHIQTKLDHALTENNYLQAHAKEANPLMNKNSPEQNKEKKDPSDWISSWQFWMSYILAIPIYLLFSFQTTFLNLGCSVILTDKLSPILLKIPALRLRRDNPRLYKLLHFSCCILGYPVACELIGFLGWMTGFSVSKTNMLNIPKPIGLMVRSGSDILSDWMLKDNAMLLWLLSICTGGIITFISYMWYDVVNKRLKTAGVKKTHIVLFIICTLVLLNHSLYRILAWFTGVTIGPITFINWLGGRKAVSSLLSLLTYSIVALFTLKLFHVNASNLIRNVFQIIQKLLFNAKSKSEK